LLLLSTGTGLAPFASLTGSEVYDRFETIVLVHGCRHVSETGLWRRAGGETGGTTNSSGPLMTEKLLYYPTVTREPFRNRGRITDLIASEQLFNDIDLPPLDIENDRIMMCGSPGMLEELRESFEARGFSRR